MEEITLEQEPDRSAASDPFEVEWAAVATFDPEAPDDDAGPSDDEDGEDE